MLLEAERTRGERLPILVDDIDAELDQTVLERLLRVVGIQRQVLLSSANGERVMAALPGGLKLHFIAGSCHHVAIFGE
jgi:recombinational DNA repair ATPase RecF